MNPNLDGVDHINIYSKAKTPLGQALSNFAHTPFKHPELGHFASVEGLWYWITRKDDHLRDLYGAKAKSYGKPLPMISSYSDDEFRRLVRVGIEAKLAENPDIMEALKASVLPLRHYYVMSFAEKPAIKIPRDNEWMLAIYEAVRHGANPCADMSNTRELESRQACQEAQYDLF